MNNDQNEINKTFTREGPAYSDQGRYTQVLEGEEFTNIAVIVIYERLSLTKNDLVRSVVTKMLGRETTHT